MKTIDLRDHSQMRLSCMSYGASGSGKTAFAGTWPRPRFLSDLVEGGWETLRYTDPQDMWEPDGAKIWPQVRAIESYRDMIEQVQAARKEIIETPSANTTPHTLVIDSLSFFARVMEDTFRTQYAAEIERNKYLLWDKLSTHLQHFMIEVHKIPGINVVWICLAHTIDDGRTGAPLLSGKMAQIAPAACNLLFYHNVRQLTETQQPLYEIRTRRYGVFPARGRTGSRLPDPLDPTYRTMIAYLKGEMMTEAPAEEEVNEENAHIAPPMTVKKPAVRRVVRS